MKHNQQNKTETKNDECIWSSIFHNNQLFMIFFFTIFSPPCIWSSYLFIFNSLFSVIDDSVDAQSRSRAFKSSWVWENEGDLLFLVNIVSAPFLSCSFFSLCYCVNFVFFLSVQFYFLSLHFFLLLWRFHLVFFLLHA